MKLCLLLFAGLIGISYGSKPLGYGQCRYTSIRGKEATDKEYLKKVAKNWVSSDSNHDLVGYLVSSFVEQEKTHEFRFEHKNQTENEQKTVIIIRFQTWKEEDGKLWTRGERCEFKKFVKTSSAEAKKKAEAQKILEEEDNRILAETYKQMEEAETVKKMEEAETLRKLEEAETLRKLQEAEAYRKMEEAETLRKFQEAEASKKLEEAETQRQFEEAETKRKMEEEAKKKSEEAEAKKKLEKAKALEKLKEAEIQRKSEEAEAKKLEKAKMKKVILIVINVIFCFFVPRIATILMKIGRRVNAFFN